MRTGYHGHWQTTAILCFFILLGGCTKNAEPAQASVSGTATFRERMALPADAVFEATLEDVSRADALAEVIGRARLESPGNPPFKFSIDYDPARIDPRHRYAVRARITAGSQLMFTSDTHYGVLTQGQGNTVDIMLRRAGPGAAPATPATSSEGSRRLQGEYSYFADTGLFVDCATGQRLPVAQEADNAALESAYLAARPEPGAPLLATVEGRIEGRMPMEGPGPRPTLIVDRFVSIGAGKCENRSTASLENTYWKLMRLGADPVSVAEGGREPHFILQPGEKRVAGSGGCNRLLGGYTLDGDRLSFTQMAGTMMACPTGMETEQAFHAALQQVASWKIDGERLALFDAGGTSLAEFESRYMK